MVTSSVINLESPIKCHDHGIRGLGPVQAEIMIIGIAPGKQEEVSRKPFQGPSGKLLNSLLHAAGFPRDSVYTTNLVCWRTHDFSTNRDPYPSEIAACWPRLIEEINTVKPKLIICLGELPAHQFITKRAYSRGALHWVTPRDSNHSCWVMHTYHPAAALREANESKDEYRIVNDIANDFLRVPHVFNQPEYKLPEIQVCDKEKAQWLLNELSNKGLIADLDIETGKDDDDTADAAVQTTVLCCSINCDLGLFIFPADVIQEIYWPIDIKWSLHNGLYDAQVLRNFGINIIIHEDTMLGSYVLNENTPNGLKSLSHQELGSPFYEDLIRPYKKDFAQAPKNVLHTYNSFDSYNTSGLRNKYAPRLIDDDTNHVYRDIMIPVANAFVDISHRGIRVDKDALKRLMTTWYAEYIVLEQELTKESGEINLNSPQQLSYFLYSKLKLPGGPSTDKNALDLLANIHPFPAKLKRYRKLKRMIYTYCVGFYDDIKLDGKLHPVILLHGAVTGRPSYTNPPAQTLPSPGSSAGGDGSGLIKEIIVPIDEDHILCEADYTRAEIYTAAAHSEDDVLMHDLTTTDFHRMAAATILGIDPNEVTDNQRSDFKRWNFGIFYGMNEYGAATRFSIHPEVAKEWMKTFFNRYKKFAAWRMEQKRRVLRDGEVRTFHGRKRRFPLIIGNKMLSRAWRQAINDPIQGDAVDNILLSVIELNERLKPYDSHILLEVHDSLLFDLHRGHLDETLPIIAETMSKSKHERMPIIPVELKLGENWAHMKKHELGTTT